MKTENMNSLDLKGLFKDGIPQYILTNGGTVVRQYLGKNDRLENVYKDLTIQHIGPDGILCSDKDETFLTWDKLGAK